MSAGHRFLTSVLPLRATDHSCVRRHDRSRGGPRACLGEVRRVSFLGPLFSPGPTEELGLNPGLSTCWLEIWVPCNLSEPQLPKGWEWNRDLER